MAYRFDGAAASAAGQALAPVHRRFELEITRFALCIGKVFERAAADFYCPRQHRAYGGVQSGGARQANAFGPGARADAGHKQGFASVNIANTDYQLATQQHLLDNRFALFQGFPKIQRLEIVAQRLYPQLAQQFAGGGAGLIGDVHHGAKAARVVQAQRALAGLQVHMVVLTGIARHAFKAQAARHAQVQQ